MLLGKLDELVIEQGGRTIRLGKSQLAGFVLAWAPASRDFLIVSKVSGKPGRLAASTVAKHREFHSAPPKTAVLYGCPDRNGTERDVGLIKSLTYVVPPSVTSPEKAGYKWVHLFGDHGESGHGAFQGEKTYPDRLKPALLVNEQGYLWIKRRPGNRYDVTKWVYW